MMRHMLILLVACSGPRSSVLPQEDTAAEADTGVKVRAVEHCGDVEGDETWVADRRHKVTCDVSVLSGTLTVEAGASVEFAAGTGLAVGTGDDDAGLVVDGAAAGVVFGPLSTEPWDGVRIGASATGVALTGLSVRATTGGVRVTGAEVFVGSLAVDGASAGCGLTLDGGARLAEGSAGVTVSGAGTWSACVDTASAESLPAEASAYTGNGDDGVYLNGTAISASATWEDLGVPYVVSDTVDVGGTAGEPAVLTLSAGTVVQFERDRGLRFSRTGAASALHVLGTSEAPVELSARGASSAGFWLGLDVSKGATDVVLSNVSILGAGGKEAALVVADVPVFAEHLIVERSETAGIRLEGTAAFAEGSTGLVIRECDLPLILPAAAVPTIPVAGLSFLGNSTDAVQVAGVSAVDGSGTWIDTGVPYWVDDDIDINGTAASPAIVTLNPGVSLLFGNNAGIFVGKTGAAGFRVHGSAALPVTMEPWSANDPGAWAGVAIYDAAVDAEVVFSHAVIGYAGGSSLKGNLHVVDASPTIEELSLHDGLEWGLYVSGNSVPVVSGVTYSNNASGECSGCP
jgi:hypothetical protein